ncbi:P-loop containing nucleoside triphosphate hydrolase protein, partial [Auricularia subglabra TFB-10046 SS5]
RTSVEIRRIDAGLRTRLYASFTEALTGIGTIRAHRAQGIFLQDCESKLDAENRVSVAFIEVWLSLYMDVLSNLLVLGVVLFAVGFRGKTNPAKMAVVLTYSLRLSSIMMFTAQTYASVEADMNAVERINVYASLPAESQDDKPDDHVEELWPSEGSVKFDNVELRYEAHLPPALNGLSFDVRSRERVAVVGRTGAGKSSILGALFRVTPTLSNGSIFVDGVDIRNISRQRLRKGLAIIPQDTVLINGTLRSNIDPEGGAPDFELFAALKRVGLADPNGKFALDRHVDQDAFSAGEKQLLAICRAMVRTDTRIMVLDEATSNVDVATDALVQQLIREDFKDRTLLCIAHRLSTILYYDRILVVQDGELAEFDAPLALYDAGGMCLSRRPPHIAEFAQASSVRCARKRRYGGTTSSAPGRRSTLQNSHGQVQP